MFAKSIRLRFQLWLAFLLVVVLSGFGFTAYRLYRGGQFREIDAELVRRIGALGVDVRGGPAGRRGPRGPRERGMPPFEDGGFREHGPPPPEGEGVREGPAPDGFRKGPPGFPRDAEFRGPRMGLLEHREIHLSERSQKFFDETETNSFFYAIWSPFGAILKQSTNAPANLVRPGRPGRDIIVQFETLHGLRQAFQFTEMGDCILVGRAIADYRAANRRFALLLLGAGAAILFIGLGGGWILTTRALQPIRDISKTATQISDGDLSRRIDAADTDSELGQLANLLNSTFSRLEAAFTQQQQFTADAAHELRTPLAVIISDTQTALARPRSAEEYRETVEACLETAQRMRALTHSLLELARFDAGQETINRQPFDLAEVARECAEAAEKIAREREIRIVTDLQSAPANGDPTRIAQVIANLLTNAIHYNKPGGEVSVSTRAGGAAAVLVVKDTGQGISAEALPHIFERFYRADPSRTRGAGHSGLGLAISKAIVDAHKGAISVESAIGEGTTFTVRL